MTGWPKETPSNMMQDSKKYGVVKTIGHRTKTHIDYDAGRGTSYSCCTALQDDVFGIIIDAKQHETIVKLSKGETIIFSSSVFHFGCNHEDFNKAYGIKFKDWTQDSKGKCLSEPRYRAFLYLDHFSTKGKGQQILDSTGETTIYVQGIIDEKYVPQSLIAETFEEAAMWLSNEKHDGWLWPCTNLVDSRASKGNSNDKDPLQKWDSGSRQAVGHAAGKRKSRKLNKD